MSAGQPHDNDIRWLVCPKAVAASPSLEISSRRSLLENLFILMRSVSVRCPLGLRYSMLLQRLSLVAVLGDVNAVPAATVRTRLEAS